MSPTASPSSVLSTAPGDVFSEVLPWLIVLLAIVVVGTIVITTIRKAIRAANDDLTQGFTLHDLRQMHAAGDLTDEQFERAKAKLIQAVRSSTSENAPSTCRPRPEMKRESDA